jgi:hypothetical protein
VLHQLKQLILLEKIILNYLTEVIEQQLLEILKELLYKLLEKQDDCLLQQLEMIE